MGEDYKAILNGMMEESPQPFNKKALGERATLINERATLFEGLLCSRCLTPKERVYVEKQSKAEEKEFWEIVNQLDNAS